jgi:hypothetical protein
MQCTASTRPGSRWFGVLAVASLALMAGFASGRVTAGDIDSPIGTASSSDIPDGNPFSLLPLGRGGNPAEVSRFDQRARGMAQPGKPSWARAD